ncbi:MAG: hypothetical protein HDQ88_06450 [Clostridia bacterium]|nr:hypothetical protein [Clostridia bacterium]
MPAYAIRVTHENHDIPYHLAFDPEGNACLTNNKEKQAMFDSGKTARLFVEGYGSDMAEKPYLKGLQFEIVEIEE